MQTSAHENVTKPSRGECETPFRIEKLAFHTTKRSLLGSVAGMNYLCTREKNTPTVNHKAIIISNTNELVSVRPERIIYISSDGNYSTMILHDKTELVFTMNLSHCRQLLMEQIGEERCTFVRMGKQLIVNIDYIFKINLNKQQLVMSDMTLNEAYTLSASRDALKKLKMFLETGKEEE